MSTCRFLHTADWQLGKPFASVRDDSKRQQLQQERLNVLHRLAAKVIETEASFVLVAGDLFDSSHPSKATVSAACAAIGAMQVPVFAIPGNHDHGGPGSIWEQEFFLREQRQLAPNLRVLLEPKPVVLENAILFPAPLLRRHEPGNPAAWIRQAATDPNLPADLPRIVLAHGTIQGFGSAQNDDDDSAPAANWIDLAALPAESIDYIALGDWHGVKQITSHAWYSGTPEPDRFPKGESNDPGHCLLVTASRGGSPVVEKISTARLRWQDLAFRFSGDEGLGQLSGHLDESVGTKAHERVLSLSLAGTLGIEEASELEKALESWEARLLHLRLERNLSIAPSEEEIAALTQRTGDPLIAAVAGQLVAQMTGDSEESAIARLALRELHAVLSY